MAESGVWGWLAWRPWWKTSQRTWAKTAGTSSLQNQSQISKLNLVKKLLGAPGLSTRNKDATRGSWHRYYEQEATSNIVHQRFTSKPPLNYAASTAECKPPGKESIRSRLLRVSTWAKFHCTRHFPPSFDLGSNSKWKIRLCNSVEHICVLNVLPRSLESPSSKPRDSDSQPKAALDPPHRNGPSNRSGRRPWSQDGTVGGSSCLRTRVVRKT